MRIAYRFLLVFVLVVLLSGAVLVVTFDAHRSDVVANTEASVADHAELSVSMLDSRIKGQQQAVALAATNDALAEHGTTRQSETLAEFVETSAFEGATVVDDTGDVRSIVTEDTESDGEELNLADREYVDRALDGEQYVSEPFQAETGNEIIVISSPVAANGEIVGTLNGAYHLDETELFDPLSGAGREAVTVEAGDQTLYSDADRFDETIDHSEDLETVDWTVTAHRDRTEVSETTTQLIVFQVVSGLAFLGSITAFGVWIYRSKIRRISRLYDRVQTLETRAYDDGAAIDGSGEWERIDTALESLVESLSRREQMLLVLNRILRHNLRNTLNVVAGRATDLESTLDDERSEAATEIRDATEELLELADRARMTESLLDPVEEPVPRTDLATVVRERVAAFDDGSETDETGGLEDVTVRGPERASAMCGDDIAVAIDELLENAVDHAGPDVSIAVTVDTDDEWVRIRIADDGPGIPANEVPVITNGRAISQVNHAGGIGLWLVDWIVSRYDGQLSIPSIEPAERAEPADGTEYGTTVVLAVPRAQDAD